MTPQEFIKKWHGCQLAERAFYQGHFSDLCALVGHPTPAEEDTTGNSFCFEKGAKKTGGGNGWADVWKRGYFAMEYKGPKGDLSKALEQVQRYALALENPPLLVVARADLIEIHTNFTNTVSDTHTIALEDIGTPENLSKLRAMFFEPEKLRPNQTTRALTEEAAHLFASLADTLRGRGHAPDIVAHFLDKLLFSFFAEDARLLPTDLVTKVLENGIKDPARMDRQLKQLFSSMCKGGEFGADIIDWFNGGLFNNDDTLPLTSEDIASLITVGRLDWTEIEPSIFGTLFERGLDPSKRSQLGAHYTDPESIMRIVTPVIVEPLLAEWEEAKTKIRLGMAAYAAGGKGSKKGVDTAQSEYQKFMQRLSDFRVLDPACGSGNFLYMALHALKDIEHRAVLEAEGLGLPMGFAGFHTGPHNVMGIELNSYAAELARVTIWIGELQWMLRHGMSPSKNPILKPLDHISCRDALLNDDGAEAEWPQVDAIVGNPPFLGGRKLIPELGENYIGAIRRCFDGRVAGGADLVCYWFDKARLQIAAAKCKRAGLVATQAIRMGSSQKVLAHISQTIGIFNAWSDMEWTNDGAAVRVSMVCFGHGDNPRLNGESAQKIYADLTAGRNDLTCAKPLPENAGIAFQGIIPRGEFTVTGDIARSWLSSPNPNGKNNSKVLVPYRNGSDIAKRAKETWLITYPSNISISEASQYELPFKWLYENVRTFRQSTKQAASRDLWWVHWCPRPEMRAALAPLSRYIVTPRVTKHRIFVWLDSQVLPDSRLYAIAREDDVTFGVLSSRIHEIWALATSSMHGVGNDPTYNAHTCFETFPFPVCAPNSNTAITAAAANLNQLRENWLNPPEWVDWIRSPEEVSGNYPARPIPKLGYDQLLKKRTLTNLYNERPMWLQQAHEQLDAAVANAYGWSDYAANMPEDEILNRLLELNLARSK